jgi:murein DD-endopeptidase MepM/ murein hydrolase activator NlpD
MAKSQWPVDGKPGKAWKVTSPFGWRVHPIKKTKKHHNGVDIWQGKNPTYLEAWADGKVIAVYKSDNPNSSGHRVDVQSTVMGKKVTWTYFHMVPGSIKVKKGERVTAGQVIGKMGESGFATGKHLHWEIWAGHVKSQPMAGFHNGKGYYDPMKFCKAVIEFEKNVVEADQETPENAPVTLAPSHSVADIPTIPVPTNPVVVPAPVVAASVKLAKPALKGALKNGSKGEQVKYLQQQLGLTIDGTFDGKTHAAVVAFQKKKKLTADGIVGPMTWKAIG